MAAIKKQRRARFPRFPNAGRPGLLAFAGVVAVLTFAILARGAFIAPDVSFGLPAANDPSKLREETAASSDRAARREPVRPSGPIDLFLPPFAAPAPAAPQAIPAAVPETARDVTTHDSQLGEPPMYDTVRTLALQFFFSGWLLALSPELALADNGQAQEKPAAAGETADRLLKIERDVADLKKQMDALKDRAGSAATPGRDLDTLREDIARLQTSVSRLQESMRNIRLSPRDPAVDRNGNGQIQIINSWFEPVWVSVDGEDYMLRPGQTRTLTRRPGQFTYEVHNIQGPRTSFLAATGQPHIIEIHPR